MARREKVKQKSIKQSVKEARDPDVYKAAATKLVVGVLHGTKLDNIECLSILKHIQTLENIAEQMRILIVAGKI